MSRSLDPVPTKLHREVTDCLLPVITRIVNMSPGTGIVKAFKTAVVKPYIKKTSLDPQTLKNYRSVPNLPFLSEISEQSNKTRILDNLNADSRFDKQHTGDSRQDLVKSQVVSELRHLKHVYHQMKRQLHHATRSFKDFQDETTVFHEFPLKKARVLNRENPSDICIRENNRLEEELKKCTAYTAAYLETRNEQLEDLDKTCQIQLSRLKTAPAVTTSPRVTLRRTSSVTPLVSTTPVTTTRPEEEKSRILIAPGWSSTPHQFRQLNIHNNSLGIYQYLGMKYVTCIAYIAKTRKLLIGSRKPNKIVSSTLDTRHVTVLRERVRTYGMAVDQDRDILFIGTYSPRYSISRMSTQGKYFAAIIDLSTYGGIPRQIALDKKRKRMYVCADETLFTVTYDGQGLTTLVSGTEMYAVALDQAAGVLYYGIEKKLMKMTVSNTTRTEVTTLNAVPRSVGLYRGNIYYSTLDTACVGAVDLKYNTVAYTLQSVVMKGTNDLLMCLIP